MDGVGVGGGVERRSTAERVLHSDCSQSGQVTGFSFVITAHVIWAEGSRPDSYTHQRVVMRVNTYD